MGSSLQAGTGQALTNAPIVTIASQIYFSQTNNPNIFNPASPQAALSHNSSPIISFQIPNKASLAATASQHFKQHTDEAKSTGSQEGLKKNFSFSKKT